jgi:hypothetical protein
MLALALVTAAHAAPTVPTEIEQPGTQPSEVPSFATNCNSCHFAGNPDPDELFLPSRGWQGSMMSNAMKDPIFWATVAVAEQDFLPNADPELRGGVGDLCLRCHGPNGWLGGRSTPTDGSSFTGADERGVECEFCHLLVNPDEPVNVSGTTEEQSPPFEAFDPVTGEGYYGSGQYVLNSDGTRLGPYGDASANHQWLQSSFHRDGRLCGTCHDVSNPAVGDLAHNFGAMLPLDPGSYSGVPGAPIEDKAAFNNPPSSYGVVERTSSEWTASALDTFRVNDYQDLPADLRVAGGSLDIAYHAAHDTNGDADYVDGTPRYFTCQSCHMPSRVGKGCNKNNAPVRDDLPWHDMTGSGYWIPEAILWQWDHGTLRFGQIATEQRTRLAEGQLRAEGMIRSAAALEAEASGETLVVRVTNLTGHKLISGYPEGRRMWLNVRWLDGGGGLIHETGIYGALTRPAFPTEVQTLLDPEEAVIYQAEPGLDQAWAAQLIDLGYDPGLALTYDAVDDTPEHTLGELASEQPGETEHSFHFVLNNVMISDNRIPPYGFDWDVALERGALPVPARQYGGRGPGSILDYKAVEAFEIPDGATSAEIRIYYQQTSWEYIQFLWLANDEQGAFLGQEGVNLLDAWLNTGMSAPVEITQTAASLVDPAAAPGEASRPGVPADQMRASYDDPSGMIDVDYVPACEAPEHTIYYGDLSRVSSYTYDGAVCALGNGGSASFDPGLDNAFFLVVGNNGIVEGSYGRGADGEERLEDTGTPACDRPQDLSGQCDPL